MLKIWTEATHELRARREAKGQFWTDAGEALVIEAYMTGDFEAVFAAVKAVENAPTPPAK